MSPWQWSLLWPLSLPLQPAPRHADPSYLFSCLFSCSTLNCPAYYVICLFTVLGISCLSLLDHRIFSHREDGDCALFKTLSQHIEQFLAPTQCSINIYGMNEVNPLRKSAWPSLAVQWIRIHLPASAGHRFNPWSGKILCVSRQLSPCTETTEPALWSPGPQLLSWGLQLLKPACPGACAPQQEKPEHCDEE